MQQYTLTDQQLTNYAKVMVHFALNKGSGINKGETVFLVGNESAKPLYLAIYKEIILAGGNVLLHYLPDEFDRAHANLILVKNGSREQLDFFPAAFYEGVIASMDHHIVILSTAKMRELEGAPPENATAITNAMSQFFTMRGKKVAKGKCSWTMCHWGTPAAAQEAGLSEESYWKQIIDACYLDHPDPVEKWKEVQEEIMSFRAKLDALLIERVRVVSEGTDLHLTIGKDRTWLGGSGQNIPSFEVFTSPDWRGTNGHISFNQPLYYAGQRISGIQLFFENGVITEIKAAENQSALVALVTSDPDANKLGEFSLTDKRHSKIMNFMANTLFDENMGGEYGNTHIAVGRSFLEAFAGEAGLPDDVLHDLHGLNKCKKVHTDIISTANRTVTATLQNGNEVIIYKDGQFVI